MNIICLDFETYYDDQYTLKKLTTEAYIRDPRFEALLCGFRSAEGQYYYRDQEWLRHELAAIDWSNTACLCHHAHFDGLILSHHFGVKPAFWFDTLAMARLVHGNHLRASLAALAERYDLAPKSIDYNAFKGKRWAEMTIPERVALGIGCVHDVELTWTIFQKLLEGFPRGELAVIDATIRMFTEPKLIGDRNLFAKIRDDKFLAKNEMLYALGVGESDLQSADKFVKLLEAEGVEVAMKPGKPYPDGSVKWNPAIAATDVFMTELVGDPDPRVAALATARLEVKSTIEETRAGRLAGMASRGPLPVYLHYCGAHTTRWSGGDSVNFQNLTDDLRAGVRAPEGYLFARVDQSQGECRILNWLAGQEDVVQRFRDGHDPYLPMASAFYRRDVTKMDKSERQVGKVLELQCGFGSGARTIRRAVRVRAGIELTEQEGVAARDAYRGTHPFVVEYWSAADWVLRALATRLDGFKWGPFIVKESKIFLPNSAWLDYTTLEWGTDEKTGERQWRLRTRAGWVKYYGAKLVENVVQALSRVVTSEAMLEIRAARIPIVGMAHDDLWMLVRDDDSRKLCLDLCVHAMARPRAWAPGLPLAAEGHLGATYGEC